jgi:hypothetical protein
MEVEMMNNIFLFDKEITKKILYFLLLSSCFLFLHAQNNYVFGPSIIVNDDPPGAHFQATTQRSIACRGDTVYLVWGDDRYGSASWDNSRVFFSKSTDAGNNWSPNLMISQDDDTLWGFGPKIALDAFGDIYVAYGLTQEPTWNHDVYFTKSTDGGTTFSQPIIVNDSMEVKSQGDGGLAVDSLGQYVYVVWEDARNFQYDKDTYLSRSTDGGVTFQPAVRVNDDFDTTRQWDPVVTCDNSGQNVYVAWQDFRDIGYGANVYFARSTDYGQTFEANYCVNDTTTTGNSKQGDPSIYFKNGIIYLAWRDERDDHTIYFNKSTDGGLSFGVDTKVRDDTTGAGLHPSICADDSGRVYVVWFDTRTYTSTGYDIYFSYSDDGGASFQADVRVNDLLGITNAWDWDPSVCANNARVFVSWQSDRNDGPGGNPDIYFASGAYMGINEHTSNTSYLPAIKIYPTIFKNYLSMKLQDLKLNDKSLVIKIFNVSGRLIKSFKIGDYLENPLIRWKGSDRTGTQCPAGTYFIVVLKDKQILQTQKVIKIK